MAKVILFVTGTRADFGKLKALIQATDMLEGFEYRLFVTGMHMMARYGHTYREIEKSGFTMEKYCNQYTNEPMDLILANTINGLSRYVHEMRPDAIVIHGDRVEALAGAIVGSISNIRVIHIEGGERSGTIDDSLRHAITKLSHVHCVANAEAKARVIQLGEAAESIYVMGSADIDYMDPAKLPTLTEVKDHYDIPFDRYHIVLFHPVTTEVEQMAQHARTLVDALLASSDAFIVIYPNNDNGTHDILREYERLEGNPRIKIYPSVRFEYFLTLIHHAVSIIGNSSAGIREAPIFGVPSINIGTRQSLRFKSESIIDCDYDQREIMQAITKVNQLTERFAACEYFGTGDSQARFCQMLTDEAMWQMPIQKVFHDIVVEG
ncbi:UDP-N-acetylglucosamine 2-epimerase (hydrolyzing) [Wohlfahrtiimonas chitiniclastica]|uniref:UDP-N-acetylglucosamine 2-epimerase n=1 Tax=Wohlfahrtiimonas chitiniclastica TaxID=400946 RepID=UPI000B993A00|nr:UDP-N-acetylglucosamine 2-epimerase [Wohlfahrtiimonas chitiniclastica]OYQ88364.1 UDP-N-acetylglucosamine 2-epimerase (hydrolyzing) [Wohlfahrtiimonas chitiniclastica]